MTEIPLSEVEVLAKQLDRAFRGRAWHGPAVTEALSGVDAAVAARPLGDAHTIWEIVRHLTAWVELALRRISGEGIPTLPADLDWPLIEDSSEASWRKAVTALEEAHLALGQAVRALEDDNLDDRVSGSDPTVRGLLFGVLQHYAYHGGQIALLKRAGPSASSP